jgi:uncharacterized flavoprotein (TIGR03862 family)
LKNITIIGGGPAALMLAAQLDTTQYRITIYDQKKSVGRKFLVAGEGGLNLTFNATIEELIAQYTPGEFMEPILRKFTNDDLRSWFKSLEIPTFLGSSNRVFPAKELKPIDVLNKITEHLIAKGVQFHLDKEWVGWNKAGDLCFKGVEDVGSEVTVFAMGGASWKVTGSNGKWADIFKKRGVNIVPFRPSNCAFGVDWNKNFVSTHAGKPLKNIALTFNNQEAIGELVISKFGLEGNAIYALSEKIQEAMLTEATTVIHLDLKPTMTAAQLRAKYKKSKLTKVTDILKEDLHLDRTAVGLLKQFTDKDTFMNPDLLADAMKSIPITLTGVDDMDKAISTLGGIALDEVDENLQLKSIPKNYAIGEMLDWYAPTGGYLLQGCFSMGFALGQYLNET